eukprot:gene2106-6991_t
MQTKTKTKAKTKTKTKRKPGGGDPHSTLAPTHAAPKRLLPP